MSYLGDSWKKSYSKSSFSLLEQEVELDEQVQQEPGLKPAADIPGRDREVLKLLKPHHDHWLLEDAPRVRYERACESLCIFVQGKKGCWEPAKAYPRSLAAGQRAYAFRRKKTQPPRSAGGGGAAGDQSPLMTLTGFSRWQQAQTTPLPQEEVVHISAPHHLAELPLSPDHHLVASRLAAPPGMALKVDGSAENTDSFRLQWEGPTSGERAVEVRRAKPRSGHLDTWQTEIPDVRPGPYTITARAGGATRSIQVSLLEPIYDIAYAPGTGQLYLLTPQQAEQLKAHARDLEEPIRYFEQTQRSGDEAGLLEARENLNRKIKPLVSGPDSAKITEIIMFKGRKWTYVDSGKLKNHVRVYSLDADVRRRRELIDSNLKDDQGKKKVTVDLSDIKKIKPKDLAEKIGRDLKENFKGEAKYALGDLDKLTGALTQWGGSLQSDHFEASAQAQLFRYTAGAGLMAGFNPKSRALSFKASAKAELALAEGKSGITAFLPHRDGYDVKLHMKRKGTGEPFDLNLGAFLIELQTALFGYAGAKAIGCADLSFTMRQGQLLVGGLNSAEAKKLKSKDKHFTPAKAEITAFAGASAGCEATGALKWDNPEKRSVPNAREFNLLASIGGSIEGNAGAGLECGFYLGYHDGNFKFRAKAGVVLGVGCGGEVVYSVDVKNTVELVQFVYHSLMQGDFDHLEFIQDTAFEAIDLLVTRCIWMGEELKVLADEGYDKAVKWWDDKQGEILEEHIRQQEAERLAKRILVTPDLLRFAPPETKGRLLRALCEASFLSREEIQEEAIIAILEWTQSQREYREILEHMTLDGSTIDFREGESFLNRILDGLEMYQFMWLQFKLALSEAFEERQKSKIPHRAVAKKPVQKRFFA